MTVTDQIKILNRKIMQNEAQYDLDRKAAKISALSSNNLDKYEYLTGEDLGLKPSTIEQTKFEYSPLGKIFNKGLDKDDKKEGMFKRLENIKDTSLTQLQEIKDQGEKQLKELKNIDKNKTLKAIDEISKKNDEANKLLFKFKKKKKKMIHLIMQNSLVQKLMELNMTLIVFCFHQNLLKKFIIMKLL